MNFKPVGDRVLINTDALETRTASGLIIPDAIADAVNRGTIVAVGPGVVPKDGSAPVPVDLAVGERVLYAPGSGLKVRVDGTDYLVLREEEVIAVVDAE